MSEIYPELDAELTRSELAAVCERQANIIANIEQLMDAWMGYCHMSGQTGRIIEEVRDVLVGEPVMAGTKWITLPE